MACGLRSLYLSLALQGYVCLPAGLPQLLALLGGLAGGWKWADSGQQKGWEGAGGSDSVGGPGIAGEGAKVDPDAH